MRETNFELDQSANRLPWKLRGKSINIETPVILQRPDNNRKLG